jgi:hypothetical protein
VRNNQRVYWIPPMTSEYLALHWTQGVLSAKIIRRIVMREIRSALAARETAFFARGPKPLLALSARLKTLVGKPGTAAALLRKALGAT